MDHYHDVFVAAFGTSRELAGLISEDCVANAVDFYINVLVFAATELIGVQFLEGFRLGGTHILSCLVEMTFWGFSRFRIILFDIGFGD